MRYGSLFIGVLLLSICITACAKGETEKQQEKPTENSHKVEENEEETYEFIVEEGKNLQHRIRVPKGYERVSAVDGSFQEFLRNYSLKEDGSPVYLYSGNRKGNQDAHIAVFELPIGNEDLQQCADSVMRMYAEYFFATEQYDKICFHFTNGFEATYTKWREGYRIAIDGNQVSWVKKTGYDESYETFTKYLRIVFAYAGTLSMESESEKIDLSELHAGDVFLQGGSPGHVVMIVDVCENQNGEKAFLLAQGYMPAQEFHLLKNPKHEEDPWYYENEISYPLRTPEYTFQEGSLKRLEYIKE